MKIIQVIHNFLPYGTGGSELYTYYLSKELSKRHKVYIFHRITDRRKEEYEVCSGNFDGLNVCRINNTWKYCNSFEMTYKNDIIARKFGVFINEVNPDIVHFHHLTCLSTTLIQEVKKRNIPVVFTLHDYWPICQRGQLLRRDLTVCGKPNKLECIKCMACQLSIKGRIEKREAIDQINKRAEHIKKMCSLVDVFISPSKFLIKKYKEFGFSENKIIYCEHGMDLNIFRNFTKKPSKNLRFGYIGTIIPSKGLHILIEAFNKIKNNNISLKIYGPALSYDGFEDYFQRLQRMVSNHSIRFMNKYENRELANILSDIDVLIIPSIWYENSPLTIKEAFMADIPLIASNIGGMAEHIQNNQNGYLFRSGDQRDLYKKIRKFIDQPDLIRKFSKNITPVKTIEKNAKEIEDSYLSLIK